MAIKLPGRFQEKFLDPAGVFISSLGKASPTDEHFIMTVTEEGKIEVRGDSVSHTAPLLFIPNLYPCSKVRTDPEHHIVNTRP